jgi:hypothetical protein
VGQIEANGGKSIMGENPALYAIAKQICHEFGLDYTDPRTGKKYPAPKKKRVKK